MIPFCHGIKSDRLQHHVRELPITFDKYKRIMLVNIKGNEGAMFKLMSFVFGGGDAKSPAQHGMFKETDASFAVRG